MKRIKTTVALLLLISAGSTAQTLSLDSCRRLALTNNKTLAIGRAKTEKAFYEQKAAKTNYLPKVSLAGSYVRTGDEISLLNKDQKSALTGMGTNAATSISQAATQIAQQNPDLAPLIEQSSGLITQMGATLNGVGQGIVDAFRTDTRNFTTAAIMLTQPLYMGGKIRAYDRITHYSEEVAKEALRGEAQEVVLEVDQAYWQVVSLTAKRRLAISYRDMLAHLNDDVQKMITEGVATKSNGLAVSVKLNEAEMALTKVDNGLSLSRMLLCQVCGLQLNTPVHLADEDLEDFPIATSEAQADTATAFANRAELQQLQLATDIYREKVNIERSAFLPQVAFMGGYLTTNPSLFNGFEKRFRGTWAVGVTLKVPIWNWGEMRYKVRAAKAEAAIAAYRYDDAREKIALQVTQSAQRVNEANRQLQLSLTNLDKAEENLRTAQAGFAESVVTTSDLLAAHTAWLQANSEKIDAQINVRLTEATLSKSLGTLTAK